MVKKSNDAKWEKELKKLLYELLGSVYFTSEQFDMLMIPKTEEAREFLRKHVNK